MNNQDHDTSRGGGGENGVDGDVTTPSSGSATATSSGGGAAPSASATTSQHQQNSSANANVSTNANTNTSSITSSHTTNTANIYSNAHTSNNVNAHNASITTANTKSGGGGARGSSTESESAARREYGERRRLANVPSDDEDDDEEMDDEEEDEEEEEEEDDEEEEHGGRHGLAHDSEGESSHRSSLSGRSRGPPTPRVVPQNPGQNASQSLGHSHSSSSSGSPVRRLPSMLRPPMGSQQQQMQSKAAQAYGASNGRGYDMADAASSPTLYGLHSRQQQAQYYESMDARYASNGNSQMSPRDTSPSAGAMAMDGSRGMAQKRRLNQSGEYGPPSQPPMPASGGGIASNATARTIYEASQHHTSSNSSSSTARSGDNSGGNSGSSGMSGSRQRAGEDDGNDDPLRFETRGSHGPRDEARYETWTSKQLRKKCSHLKLRGLKNVKKHVMVEALYRYYRNQRGKQTTDGGSSTMRGSSTTSGGHNTSNGNNNNTSGSHGERGASGSLNEGSQSSRRFHDAYAQSSSQRYEHVTNASTSSSNYLANAVAASLLRGNRSSSGGNNGSNAQQQQQQHIARRSSPSSSTGLTMRPAQRSSSLGGGEGRNADYDAGVDLEESKYESQPNEMRITSEDVIRLVDVILSPEFVDRLTGELSRWQFWVDIREKYVSLVSSNSASSYGAARGLTALGGDRHQPGQGERSQGGNSGASVDRMSMNSGYVRPSAKWSSMQLWEMWKELTFAYTKTCFEFTAAGMRSVDERNYIQFCEGRPDVYYLHQRLHARPDLLHLIKSNEYIEEKCSSDVASEHTTMTAEKNAANTLMGVSTPGGQRPHKRFKRIVPAGSVGGNGSVSGGGGVAVSVSGSVPNGGPAASSSSNYKTGQANADGASNKTGPTPVNGGCDSGNASGDSSGDNGVGRELASQNAAAAGGRAPANNGDARQYLATNGMRGPANNSPSGQPEEGSTENSETTGEDNSVEKSNSNATSDSTRREALAEQKYFGLLLQNFEAIFESLHNKKVLLAALRKDSGAPDHLIADLHDDIHVLSALKKDFRNKLRQALE